MKLTKTRFAEISYASIKPKGWSFFDSSTGNRVGEIYASKAELLSDLSRYAKESWGL